MSVDDLRRSLKRFQKKDYSYFIQHWKPSVAGGRPVKEVFDNDVLESIHKLSKKSFIQAVLKLFIRKKPKTSDIAKSDLLYMRQHSKSYIWHCYCIERIDVEKTLEPNEFSVKLQEELQLLFDGAEVYSFVAEELYWVRVNIYQQSVGLQNICSCVYLIHMPHTPYFLATTIKQTHVSYLVEALEQVLDGQNTEQLQLSGHCVHSLFQILLHGASQGEFNRYRLNLVDGNPLLGRKRRKLKDSPEECVEIVNENQEDRLKRKRLLEDTFGAGEQPTLEKVEYKIESQFKGVSVLPMMTHREETFHCRVKFEGRSVMEGMRGLAKAGLVDVPLKSHLCRQIYSRRTNTLMLTQKRPREKT